MSGLDLTVLGSGQVAETAAASEAAEREPDYRPLKTYGGSGLLPGIDLMDSRALADAMDGKL